MLKEEMLENYGYLNRLAESKCRSCADAEDLVSETMLAAFAYLKRGGINLSSEEDFEEEFMRSQEAAELRRELLRLSKTYCEVLIRPNSETADSPKFRNYIVCGLPYVLSSIYEGAARM